MIRRRDLVVAGTALGGWAAMGLPRPAWAASAAQTAVDAAKEYAGTEITIVWEAGPPGARPAQLLRPEVEGAHRHRRQGDRGADRPRCSPRSCRSTAPAPGAYDALNVIPSWMPDLVRAGALEDLDPYVDKYGFREELQEIAPVYRDNQMTVDGKIYGFPDDGDVFVLYYRTDVLGDPKIQAAYKAKYGSDLPVPPKTWKEFDQVGSLITEITGGKPYGAGFFRQPPYAQFMFQERFRNEGGKFFDAATMKATVNGAGRRQGVHRTGSPRTSGCRRAWRPGTSSRTSRPSCGRHGHDHLLAALRPLGRGLRHRREGAVLGAEDPDRGQGRLRHAAGRPSGAGARASRSRVASTPRRRTRPICSSSG